MADKPVCLVCQVEMEFGFMGDVTHESLLGERSKLPRWCPGKVERDLMGDGIKSSQLAKGLPVVAYRCPKCEALRFYARQLPKPAHA